MMVLPARTSVLVCTVEPVVTHSPCSNPQVWPIRGHELQGSDARIFGLVRTIYVSMHTCVLV